MYIDMENFPILTSLILVSVRIKKIELIIQQRIALKFCFRAGFSATETLGILKKACGEQTLKRCF